MNLRNFFDHCDAVVARRSLLVALVVGPTLILVNQGFESLGGAPLDYGKATLTMLVPFLVSCFSGTIAGVHGSVRATSREERLASGLSPVVEMVRQVQTNAINVNSTAKARFEETQALLRRAQQTVAEIEGGAVLVQSALEASEDVQRQFDLVLRAEAEVKTEIASSSGSAAAVSAAISVAKERFTLISNLAFEIGRIGHQTTLLSLNAAVVAATAGPEGKRFAAIAESVRELARETEAQAKAIHTTTRELEESAVEMANESTRLGAGMARLLECSERSNGALAGATSSMARSADTTRRSLQLLSTQSGHIRDVAAGISRVVDHAEAAIEGSARNAGLAREVAQRLGTLVEVR